LNYFPHDQLFLSFKTSPIKLKLCTKIDIPPKDIKHLYLRSSSIKELAHFGGDLKDLVPDAILLDVEKKLKKL